MGVPQRSRRTARGAGHSSGDKALKPLILKLLAPRPWRCAEWSCRAGTRLSCSSKGNVHLVDVGTETITLKRTDRAPSRGRRLARLFGNVLVVTRSVVLANLFMKRARAWAEKGIGPGGDCTIGGSRRVGGSVINVGLRAGGGVWTSVAIAESARQNVAEVIVAPRPAKRRARSPGIPARDETGRYIAMGAERCWRKHNHGRQERSRRIFALGSAKAQCARLAWLLTTAPWALAPRTTWSGVRNRRK
jgi:hypothetical protein